MDTFKKNWLALSGVVLMSFAGGAAAAYPDKPISIIIPYAPGAAGDVIFRMLQPELSEELGETLVVDYKTGAGGNIGASAVARAKPDGYTLLFAATNNFVINQFVYKEIGYEPLKDLYVIDKVADAPAFVFVSANTQAKTMDEFRDYVQKNKGKTNYGSPGAGTTPALSAWKLSDALGADMLDIHYRGSSFGVQALLSNDVQMYIGGYGLAAAFLADNKVHAIGVASEKRFPTMPDVPTMDELGLKDVVVSNWWALAAPTGTDKEITHKIEKALLKVMNNENIREKLLAQGYVVSTITAAEFRDKLPQEAKYWQKIVKESGANIQ